MNKLFISIAMLLVLLTGCAPGSSVEVNTPATSIQLTTPGPNPELDKPAENGQVASVAQGLWHGLIAPVTLVGSFFNPAMQMYEVHNDGKAYNLGFLFGVALVFLILGLIGGRRR
ncbi:MAG TPA: hypothetical protein VF896_08420 [Anaerolineales bacterium]